MSQIRSLMLTTAVLAMSSSAFAADLAPQAAEPAAPVALFSWTGAYAGIYAGGSFGTDRLKNKTPADGGQNVTPSLGGATAGGLAGYNYQINSFVLGAEGEFGYDGATGDKNFLNPLRVYPVRNAKFEESYIGRVRGRVGYAFDNLLIYGAAGVSFADAKVTQSIVTTGLEGSIKKNIVGWNAGLGAEYAFTPNWVVRAEYIYDGFSEKTYDFRPRFTNRDATLEKSTVRAAVEYKF